MELQVSVWYFQLSLGINMIRNINFRTPVCTFFNNPRLVQEYTIRSIAKYLVSTSTYIDILGINLRLITCGVVYSLTDPI